MNFLVQFGINKHLLIFSDHELNLPYELVQFCWSLKKFTSAYLFQIALEIMWLHIKTEWDRKNKK